MNCLHNANACELIGTTFSVWIMLSFIEKKILWLYSISLLVYM